MKTLILVAGLMFAFGSSVVSADPGNADEKQDAGAKKVKLSAAEEYAGELSKLLAGYQKQLAAKITAEQQAYTDAAKLYDDAFRENVFASLSLDRTADAQHAQRALEANNLTPDKLLDDVFAYAQRDFDQTRTLYQLGVDSYRSYLANLNDLQIDSQKVGALIKMLDDLAKKPNWKGQLSELKTYGENFNKQYHFSQCSLADSLLSIQTGKKTALDKQVQTITGQIAAAAAGADVSSLQAQKSALEQEVKNAQAEITRLQTQRDNSGGYTPGASGVAGTCEVK